MKSGFRNAAFQEQKLLRLWGGWKINKNSPFRLQILNNALTILHYPRHMGSKCYTAKQQTHFLFLTAVLETLIQRFFQQCWHQVNLFDCTDSWIWTNLTPLKYQTNGEKVWIEWTCWGPRQGSNDTDKNLIMQELTLEVNTVRSKFSHALDGK